MKYIAHRGNIEGRKPDLENSPAYIDLALREGYYVEVDVWGTPSGLFLGHDRPEYLVTEEFFEDREWRLFCHCKNVDALSVLQKLQCPSYFFHENDPYTITSNGFIWCYPNCTPPTQNAIIVMPEKWMDIDKFDDYATQHNLVGVCSDVVKLLKYK
jgi:hypothetical protein